MRWNSGISIPYPATHSFCVASNFLGFSPSLRLFSWIIPMHLIYSLCEGFFGTYECASFIEIIRVITAKHSFFCFLSHWVLTKVLTNNILSLFLLTFRYYWGQWINPKSTIQRNQKEPSQNLRSALEEKARKQQPGPTKPKRKMKPGQAKTINDLPQLSAWG